MAVHGELYDVAELAALVALPIRDELDLEVDLAPPATRPDAP